MLPASRAGRAEALLPGVVGPPAAAVEAAGVVEVAEVGEAAEAVEAAVGEHG